MSSPRTFIIDFESFYSTKDKYSLKHMSYLEFIHDRRFRIFGMAVADEDGETAWVPAEQVPEWLEDHQGDIFVMHNAFFDAAVLAWHYKFNPAYMIDTLLLANHVLGSARDAGGEGNGLDALARRLGLDPKGSNKKMDGVSEPDESQLALLAIYAKQDAKLAYQVLNILLPQMSNADFELWLLDHSLRIYTEKTLDVDLVKIKAARKTIEKRFKEMLAASGVAKEVLMSNKQFAEELERRLTKHKMKVPMKSPPKPRQDGVTSTPALAKGDPAFQELAESSIAEISDLVRARMIVKSAATTQARLATMEKYAKLGIGIPVHLVYYGAHTGRFAGGGGFNFQNLTSPARATDPLDREIAALVREAIVPGKGRVFVPVDAAQIEARVLAWLAGEQQILDAYASGADIYSDFIGEVLGEKITKHTDGMPKEVASYNKLMRQAGKESILGLGFSMGVKKFGDRLRKERALRPLMVKGGKLDAEVQEKIVETYRSKYMKIVGFWDSLNRAFNAAIQGSTRKVGYLLIKRIGPKAVAIVLPSGRKLYYRNLRQETETTPSGGQRKVWKHGAGQRIYGGLLAENVTQAIARDILAESIHDCEVAGYPVVLHIHDEVVPRVPKVQGEAALKFLIDSLSTPPSWGEGLVLGAEGHIAENLSK